MTGPELERVVLVGFMGAGKTSVGRAVAEALGWRFLDFDAVVEAEQGASVPEIFRAYGEERFRELERAVAERLLAERNVVLGSGGGWAAEPGRLSTLPPGTESVWLKVSARTAMARASEEPGRRPLLEVDDPLAVASELLDERAEAYAAAKWTVDTEGRTVEDVSARILEILAEVYPETARDERD